MQDNFVPGRLYRAVTKSELVAYEPIPVEGLKLLVLPAQVRILKSLQKALRREFGSKPDMTIVLNALIALPGIDAQTQPIAEWIREHRSRVENETKNSSSAHSKTLTDLLKEHSASADDEE